MKTCKKCHLTKDENEFYVASWDATKRRATCIACHKAYHVDNLDTIRMQRKKFREENKEIISAQNKTDKRRAQNRACNLKRRLAGKVKVWEKNKKKNDPAFRLRKYLSSKINRALKGDSTKKYMSFLKYVPYTMEQLKEHIEKQFESWMTWNNQGPYRVSTWDDTDKSTWTWQLDHIIPQSDLPYISMTDENFKKCWALENLRPLDAKRNLIEGTQKVRHSKF